MPKATVQLFGDGRVTIPKSIRDALGLEDGDVVELDVEKVQKTTEAV